MPTRKIHPQHPPHLRQRHAVAIPTYSSELPSPVARLPKTQTPASTAYRMIHEALQLDNSCAYNLSAFDHVWSEPESVRLIQETYCVNDWARIERLQQSCLSIFSDLFHASHTTGTCTASPTEAVQLAGLAMLWNWRNERASTGRSAQRPNLVLGKHAPPSWEQFGRHFGVELRRVSCPPDHYRVDLEQTRKRIDAQTIGVVGVLGGAPTGNFDSISELNDIISDLNRERGWNVPLHVDAAAGGFVASFLTPELVWDFQLPCVSSIHVSGRGYGMVNPGVEWILWRDRRLDFQSPAANAVAGLVAQYYHFLRLGRDGYSSIMRQLWDVAQLLTEKLRATGRFEILSQAPCLPTVCCRLVEDARFTASALSAGLRECGWNVPVESFSQGDQAATDVLRIVVQEGFSRSMTESFIKDLHSVMRNLGRTGLQGMPRGVRSVPQIRATSVPVPASSL